MPKYAINLLNAHYFSIKTVYLELLLLKQWIIYPQSSHIWQYVWHILLSHLTIAINAIVADYKWIILQHHWLECHFSSCSCCLGQNHCIAATNSHLFGKWKALSSYGCSSGSISLQLMNPLPNSCWWMKFNSSREYITSQFTLSLGINVS